MKKQKQNDFKIDFVGIGAIKCATSWIYECLQEHPQIYLVPKDQSQVALFLKSNPSEKEINNYKSFFKSSKSSQLKGDFHVAYMRRGEVIARMKRHNPELKIIVCLRNPIKRAYSQYRFINFAKSEKEESFEEAIKTEPAILESGFYCKYLKKFFDAFPRENILVLIYEDIEKDSVKFIRRIYQFLGVDLFFIPPTVRYRVNFTKFKLTTLGRLIHKGIIKPLLKNTRWAWKLKRSLIIKKLFYHFSEAYVGKKDSEPSIREETRHYLQEIYQEDIQNLEKLIGRDLSFWQ